MMQEGTSAPGIVDRAVRRPFTTLRRFTQRPGSPPEPTAERCELCGNALPEAHRHLLELPPRTLLCVCRACSILFDREAASQGKYRLIPDPVRFLEGFRMSDAQWESLRIPVDMAFLFWDSPTGQVAACYPGPMGAAESFPGEEIWNELRSENPALAAAAPDVEALLVNRIRGARDCYLAPIDDCFRLAGIIRMHWKGLGGGEQVWEAIGQFFGSLKERAGV
jgi:hypothetical protein